MKKRILCVLLILVLCIGLLPTSGFAAQSYSDAEQKASALKTLSLFQGVSENDFALNRAPTRTEALIIFLRMLGEESDARAGSYSHPFGDVPAWADAQVGYAYQMGYTSGVSKDLFGANNTATAAMYLTFILRALGYVEGNGGDFEWDNPFPLARQIGILPSSVDTSTFLRADAVLIAWETLFVPMKDGNKDLCDILVMSGAFTQQQLDSAVAMVNKSSESTVTENGVKLGNYICYSDANGFSYDTEFRPVLKLDEYQLFFMAVNTGKGMQECNGKWRYWEEDSGEGYIFLDVTTTIWDDSRNYTFFIRNDGSLVSSDGYIGITPADSLFQYMKDYQGDELPPPPPPGDDPASTETGSTVGTGVLPKDDKESTTGKELFGTYEQLEQIDWILWGDPPPSENPQEASDLLRQLRNGEKFLSGNSTWTTNNGYIQDEYEYWGSRALLEEWAEMRLRSSSMYLVTPQNIQAEADFFQNHPHTLGVELGACLQGSDYISKDGYSILKISNDESETFVIPGSTNSTQTGPREVYRRNVNYDFRWNTPVRSSEKYLTALSMDELLAEIASVNVQRDTKKAIAIDPEKRIIAMYVLEHDITTGAPFEHIWVFYADVNAQEQLVLRGFEVTVEDCIHRTITKREHVVDIYQPN